MSDTGVGAINIEEIVKGRIFELQEALEKATPNYTNILREIHNTLKNDPDVVTLLTEDEIGTITAALKQHKNVVITSEAVKKVSKKKLSSIDEDDI
jgi:hypothetical protein